MRECSTRRLHKRSGERGVIFFAGIELVRVQEFSDHDYVERTDKSANDTARIGIIR